MPIVADIPENEIAEKIADPAKRVALAKKSFFHFISIYLRHLFPLPPADFHEDIIEALESEDIEDRYISIMGFRGSAKSTILQAFCVWSMINDKHNFIAYVSHKKNAAKMKLRNISNIIEENDLLRQDFNIELEDSQSDEYREKWSETQITANECTVIPMSTGADIRGALYKDSRVDLIICDDIETKKGASTKKRREKTEDWFVDEVLPATDQGVQADDLKVVVIGNKVHRDCLQMRLKENDLVNSMEFPLLDEEGNVTWEALYPTQKHIEQEKQKVMISNKEKGKIVWHREYLLELVDQEDKVMDQSEIQYYPKEWLQKDFLASGVGGDFAFGKKKENDYTAFVKMVEVKNSTGERRWLVLPNPFKGRVDVGESREKMLEIEAMMPRGNKWYPEDATPNMSILQHMEDMFGQGNVKPQKAVGDKKSRLQSAVFYAKNGQVLFPKEGAEDLITNIVDFGIEEHDDLADAWAYVVLGMVKGGSGQLIG